MIKFFSRFFFILLIISVSLTLYLSYFGIETDRFDKLIKNKANEVNKFVKLEFKTTKIHINPTKFNLVVKLQNPKILVKKNEIILSKLNLFLPLKSFLTSDFLIKKAEVAFKKNDIKDLTKITSIFLPKIINKQLNKVFSKGNLEGEFFIPFEKDGGIGKDYGFSGKVSDAQINITREFSINNLTTKIKHKRNIDSDEFKVIIAKGSIYDLELEGSTINITRQNSETYIESLIRTNGKFDFKQINKLSNVFALNTRVFKNINGTTDLKSNVNFKLDKRLRMKNLSYAVEGDINNLEIHTKEKKVIKKYLPQYNSKIILKDTKIKVTNSKSKNISELDGLIKLNDNFDKFKIKEVRDNDKKSSNINGVIDLTNTKIEVSRLNYIKENGNESQVSFDANFIYDNYYNIKNLNFSANKNKINLLNLKLNKFFEVVDFEKLSVKTFSEEIKNNDFLVTNSGKIVIYGEVFDAQPLLKSLYKKSDKKTFDKNFNSEIKINFDKALTGTNDNVDNFSMIAAINGGSYNKLSLKGNFSKNEIIEMSIYQVDNDKKTLQVISDRARPFIKNFDFIEGFEGGKLEYESIISKKSSRSNLLITDFKVSKVPALAQLLTLASLQGIADTLSGEGIRFESFEMKSNTEGNVLNIEDALAIGPAVSILLDGYVEKGKVVSLRGTLVPATKLNAIIASIPLVGNILVGKKTGEGVVGVSFKMKGPPKDIKTTVNPIKTLTPRFIVRAVEKIQKKKKKETK